MQEFFFEPISELLGFDPSSVGQEQRETYEPLRNEEKEASADDSEEISERDLERFADKQEKIEERLSHEPTRYKDITCPHCGEIIRVKE